MPSEADIYRLSAVALALYGPFVLLVFAGFEPSKTNVILAMVAGVGIGMLVIRGFATGERDD